MHARRSLPGSALDDLMTGVLRRCGMVLEPLPPSDSSLVSKYMARLEKRDAAGRAFPEILAEAVVIVLQQQRLGRTRSNEADRVRPRPLFLSKRQEEETKDTTFYPWYREIINEDDDVSFCAESFGSDRYDSLGSSFAVANCFVCDRQRRPGRRFPDVGGEVSSVPCIRRMHLCALAPAHRYRKVKSAPIIEQAYTRGMTNNGFIEVEEDDESEGADDRGIRHPHQLRDSRPDTDSMAFFRLGRASVIGRILNQGWVDPCKPGLVEALKRNIAQTLEPSRGDGTGSDPKVPRSVQGNGTEDTMQILLSETEEQENKPRPELSAIPVQELNRTETDWLVHMNWSLYVNLDESGDYNAWLGSWTG
ncbi:uncharacterized protein PG986_005060 [Apiospora aurea]|uniref:Uncharacterized protein n=1 Tax=Apiospora aurea TaxID=335848 RepID=A0ABR1QGG8_9PEZI